jgi:xanthine dehydrogenase iron-sulfur cluster and FAD-binding subunit A
VAETAVRGRRPSGNICRSTGYQGIVRAVLEVDVDRDTDGDQDDREDDPDGPDGPDDRQG